MCHFTRSWCPFGDYDAISNALNAVAEVRGATVATALVGIAAEDLPAESWVSRLKRMMGG
jgi:hypothetical protein